MSMQSPKPIAPLASITDAQTRVIQRRVMIDGKQETRIERVPHGRFMKVVKPSGAVSRIPLHNGRSNATTDDPYRRYIEERKALIGCVPYGRCPQTLAYEITSGFLPPKWYGPDQPVIPDHLRDKQPCRESASGKRIDNENPCQCIEDLITHRKAEQAKRMDKAEVRSAQSENAKAQVAATADLATAVQGVAEVVRDMQSRTHGNNKGKRDE
jgi:hypothetical protein